jgi:DNA-binding response OmpR family regulator
MIKVLVVEPDRKLGQIYANVLRSRKHKVSMALTAQDAILAADANKPDVVLLELQLTAHSGIEFLYEFRSYTDWINIPVIILSNVPPAEFKGSHKLLGSRLGVVAYHYKSQTSLQTILHAVENAIAVA